MRIVPPTVCQRGPVAQTAARAATPEPGWVCQGSNSVGSGWPIVLFGAVVLVPLVIGGIWIWRARRRSWSRPAEHPATRTARISARGSSEALETARDVLACLVCIRGRYSPHDGALFRWGRAGCLLVRVPLRVVIPQVDDVWSSVEVVESAVAHSPRTHDAVLIPLSVHHLWNGAVGLTDSYLQRGPALCAPLTLGGRPSARGCSDCERGCRSKGKDGQDRLRSQDAPPNRSSDCLDVHGCSDGQKRSVASRFFLGRFGLSIRTHPYRERGHTCRSHCRIPRPSGPSW